MMANATERFVSFVKGDICFSSLRGKIVVDSEDWQGVKMAAASVKEDLTKVIGRCDLPIVIGTLGKSRAIEEIMNKNQSLKKELEGKWEK